MLQRVRHSRVQEGHESRYIAEFIRSVRKDFRPKDPGSFWICETAFRELLTSPFLADAINGELRRTIRDDGYLGDWIASEFVLHRDDGFALAVSFFDAPQRYIHALPYLAMYAPMGPGGCSCATYRLPDGFHNAVFDPGLKLEALSSESFSCGEVILLHSNKHAYDLRVKKPTPVVKFMTKAIQPMEWLFTRDGLQAWQANDGDLSFTQLRVAADVLGRFAHQSSVEPLKRLAHHAHHAVRWAAIQNLGRISRSEAIIHLRAAIDDPHPHLRRAAQRTLDKLQPK